MRLLHSVTLVTFSALVAGTPTDSVLQRRADDKYDTYAKNCDDPPPRNSGYKPPAFPTRKSVVQAAFVDAVTLAGYAFEVTNDIETAKKSVAYNHYYDSEFDGAKEMLKHVNNMALWISAGRGDPPNKWNVHFDCSGTIKDCVDYPDSLAATDPIVGGTIIAICNPFWTAPSTAFLISGNNPENAPYLEKPYRSLDSSGWCNTRKPANFFATAGTTILHELTHLDSIGELAGLEGEPPNNQHGTDDYQDQDLDGCQLQGARRYLERWRKDRDGLASPDYNAESLAGFATERLWTATCAELEDIPE